MKKTFLADQMKGTILKSIGLLAVGAVLLFWMHYYVLKYYAYYPTQQPYSRAIGLLMSKSF
jgi:hypothetical protein